MAAIYCSAKPATRWNWRLSIPAGRRRARYANVIRRRKFLVSPLALALSDLVSHKTRIDSLFLDEGFGTLDSETLDAALDALDALNASGKTIGVISHVEAMKERIPVQIKVKKSMGLVIANWTKRLPWSNTSVILRTAYRHDIA